MQPDDNALLLDIVIAARKIRAHTDALSYDDLLKDELRQFGLVKLFEIIGEAANHLSDETRVTLSMIPWADVITMRHVMVHDYGRIDMRVVWRTITRDIPELLAELEPRVQALLPDEQHDA
jgi:uncharacterized protein with HEPN domain